MEQFNYGCIEPNNITVNTRKIGQADQIDVVVVFVSLISLVYKSIMAFPLQFLSLHLNHSRQHVRGKERSGRIVLKEKDFKNWEKLASK